MSWKACMSCAASSSCLQSSPLLTMTALRAQPFLLPCGLIFCTRAALAANLVRQQGASIQPMCNSRAGCEARLAD